MPEVADHPPQPVDRRGRRIYIWWAVSLVLLALLGVFCWTVVVPVWQVRRAVDHLATGGYTCRDPRMQSGIEDLGGRGPAVRKINMYLHAPRVLAPRPGAALNMLAVCDEDAVPFLGDVVSRHKDMMFRTDAAETLGNLHSAGAIPVLSRVVCNDTEMPSVRFTALYALSKHGGPAVPHIMALLSHKDSFWRKSGAWVLGLMGQDAEAAVPDLRKVLLDEDPAVHSAAAEALKKIRGEGAKP